jgi:hypothetical protein
VILLGRQLLIGTDGVQAVTKALSWWWIMQTLQDAGWTILITHCRTSICCYQYWQHMQLHGAAQALGYHQQLNAR